MPGTNRPKSLAPFDPSYPKAKFRPIEGHNLNCKVYEAKKGIIRVYLFHQENTGRIIVTGGKKGNQKKDIKSIIKTIQDYYNEQGESYERKNN